MITTFAIIAVVIVLVIIALAVYTHFSTRKGK